MKKAGFPMEYEQALAWVHGLPRTAPVRGAENERLLLAQLGHPEAQLKFVHIAGTNGKGSTAVMLASILHRAGYKTGLNISPYVIDFRERFQIDGQLITPEELADILTRVRAAAEALAEQGMPVMEFTAVTAAALLWFARQKCDIVVLETGIGGRLDATNAVQNTLVACITAIGKDHTDILGDTYEKIAAEKCGIFKNKCTVVCYPRQPRAAMDTIVLQARRAGCPLTVPEVQDVHIYKGLPFENRVDYGGYDLVIPFPGAHQALNAAVALEAALALDNRWGYRISDEAITEGIRQARFPARIQIIGRSPLIILDGAHNPDGVAALADTLRAAKARGLSAVMGILQDKGAGEMLSALSPFVAQLYTVTPASPRAITAGKLAEHASRFYPHVTACESVSEALELARLDAQDCPPGEGGVLICGSLYLASEAWALLQK